MEIVILRDFCFFEYNDPKVEPASPNFRKSYQTPNSMERYHWFSAPARQTQNESNKICEPSPIHTSDNTSDDTLPDRREPSPIHTSDDTSDDTLPESPPKNESTKSAKPHP